MIFQPLASSLQLLLSVLSSVGLLVLAFPSFNQLWAAWVALVPWLVLLQRLRGRAALWWSWLIGFLFFLGSIWWLIHVTVIGWVVLCAYLALYFGAFGWAIAKSQSWVLVPAVWVALEYTRSHLFSGFGWNLLAYSQTPWTPLIQMADITGVWGVSFLIVMVNVGIASALNSNKQQATGSRGLAHVAGCWSLVAAVVVAAFGYGGLRLRGAAASPRPVRVAVVQGNIPQEEKWDGAFKDDILRRYERLTQEAAASAPDLIIWPETSVPGFFNIDEHLTQRVIKLAKTVQRPLLVGSPAPRLTPDGVSATNRATLLDGAGNILASYDKLHLVPFGEFVPGDRVFPWLRNLLPPIGNFVPGRDYTVFKLGSRLKAQGSKQEPDPLQPSAFSLQLRFSVLICFEDIFPNLARRFVQRGAQALVVITNDAWFGPTAAAYQHAQASTFRAVELRVPVVRAANTGWSGCIDPLGQWMDAVHDDKGRELFVEGTLTCALPLANTPSLYRRWGDWFAWCCLLASLTWIGIRLCKK